MEERVQRCLAKANEFIGIPYSPWNPNVSCYGDHGPFWSFNGPAPTTEQVKEGLLNCVGLVNVIRRDLGLEIPGATDQSFYAGGTHEWCTYLNTLGHLQSFKITKVYPKGTLLLRRYRSEQDDGHVAIVSDKRQIIHSVRRDDDNEYGIVSIRGAGGVKKDIIWRGYYDYACPPEGWLQ